ncbi:MAG: ATP-binding cassette domain-containing protein [Pseudomonadales bacterium]|nr:ATP-binding cassette domain-containing protein [Pseudomonadales bacterium]
MTEHDTMPTGLCLEKLEIVREGLTLVSLDTRIAPGEVLTVMGSSGSGKSTLLAVIAGAVAPVFQVSGRVLLDGRDLSGLPPQQRHVGLLFQDDILFPHLSVGGNLAFALPPALRGRAARRARVEEALMQANLKGFAERDPATLSGGQRARVALMRMLLAEPRVLLLDEPFSKLDAELRLQFRQFVFTMAKTRLLPVLMVTHDIEDARAAIGMVVTPKGKALTI